MSLDFEDDHGALGVSLDGCPQYPLHIIGSVQPQGFKVCECGEERQVEIVTIMNDGTLTVRLPLLKDEYLEPINSALAGHGWRLEKVAP